MLKCGHYNPAEITLKWVFEMLQLDSCESLILLKDTKQKGRGKEGVEFLAYFLQA